jgi:hypothetical protein
MHQAVVIRYSRRGPTNILLELIVTGIYDEDDDETESMDKYSGRKKEFQSDPNC